MESEILLQSKLRVPLIRPESIVRQRLLDFLNDSLSKKIILVSAPAGYGKTSLASQWVRHLSIPHVWLSLEKDDNDLVRFLVYLIAALGQIIPSVDASIISMLQSPQPSSIQDVLSVILNRTDTFEGDFVIVLDDYHLVEEPLIHQAVEFIIDHMPLPMHLVIITRADPPMRLARLRGQRKIADLRMRDLRFRKEEAAEFLRSIMDVEIRGTDLSKLLNRTEGWITGLQMAAVSMKGKDDPGLYIETFSGSHHYILDYLLEEVFSLQAPDVQDFLLKTSILDRLSADLCDEVLDIRTSSEILRQLEKSNLFIVPLDDNRHWYRYHALFADLLRIRLMEEKPKEVHICHSRASSWFYANGFLRNAVDHAISANDFKRAVTIISDIAEEMLKDSLVSTLRRWVRKLPEEMIKMHPELDFLALWAQMVFEYDYQIIEDRLNRLKANTPELQGRIAAMHAFIKMSEADFDTAGSYAGQALEGLSIDDDYFRSIALWVLGLCRATRQNLKEAAEILSDLLEESRKCGNTMFVVMTASQLGKIELRLGNIEEAKTLFSQGLDAARIAEGDYLPIAGEAFMGLGELYREVDDLDKAADFLLEGIELTSQWRDVAAMEGYLSLSRVRQAQEQWDSAQDALDKAMRLAIKYDAIDVDDRLVRMHQARFWLIRGEMQKVEAWAQEVGFDHVIENGFIDKSGILYYLLLTRESILFTQFLIRKGSFHKALEWIEKQLPAFQQLGKTDVIIELHLYRASAFDALGREEDCIKELNQVLQLAEGTGFRRLFLDLDDLAVGLLRKYQSRLKFSNFLEDLRKPAEQKIRTTQKTVEELIEPLTDRERDILRFLPTNLTTPEIAEEMVIGVNTVRTHIKNIYGKIGAHDRSEAVRRSRKLKII